ncbi:Homeobox protein knotted-1-like 1 [Abeliophyllum distichum]|uniref:Homeobox protein knotted-1-like 1 n=1 Tax=Abeliophyllum distichum TaxID=126358 RepID=A0ABD1SYN7_9LAMI
MDEYNQLGENTSSRGSFLYGGPILAPNSSLYGRTNSGSNNQQSQLPINNFHLQSSDCYDQSEGQEGTIRFKIIAKGNTKVRILVKLMPFKAKIIAHPQYSNLLEAYMDCQKVGAPPEVVARLTAVLQEFETRQRASAASRDVSKDPELDQFMEAYYDMLVKYREELTRPLQEAMEFMRRIETQLNMLT